MQAFEKQWKKIPPFKMKWYCRDSRVDGCTVWMRGMPYVTIHLQKKRGQISVVGSNRNKSGESAMRPWLSQEEIREANAKDRWWCYKYCCDCTVLHGVAARSLRSLRLHSAELVYLFTREALPMFTLPYSYLPIFLSSTRFQDLPLWSLPCPPNPGQQLVSYYSPSNRYCGNKASPPGPIVAIIGGDIVTLALHYVVRYLYDIQVPLNPGK